MPELQEEELQEFIQYSLSKGLPRKTIEQTLIQSGWPRRMVEKLFSQTHAVRKPVVDTVLRVQSISKAFDSRQILSGITLTIKPAEVFGIIGLSGSGKTTLLNIFVGFIVPDAGDVLIKSPADGKEYSIFAKPHIVKTTFGFATQTPSFYEQLTVAENVDHFASLYDIPKKERIPRANAVLRMVGLLESKNQLGKTLSGGMQKRLDIACALMHDPQILIMDEPTADLDPLARTDMWNLVKEINRKGTTVIIASHFLSEIEDFCSRIAILHNKKIMEIGTPTVLKNVYSKNYEIVVELGDGKAEKLLEQIKRDKSLHIEKTVRKGQQLVLYTAQPKETLSRLSKLLEKSDFKLVRLAVNKPTLRELFEAVVKKQ